MFDRLRDAVLRLLRVPRAPTAPADGGAVRVFRAAPNYYRYLLARWGLGQLGALLGLVGTFVVLQAAPPQVERVADALVLFETLAWIGFLLQLPVGYAKVRLDFELRWYIVTGRSLRIREGLWTVQERTMTFANVQNMAVRQGPLQRLLGIADLEVHTAGGGGAAGGKHGTDGGDLHRALLRGVADAAAIRDLIGERVRRLRDAGLGDPDDVREAPAPPALPPAPSPDADPVADLLAAARELRRAVRGDAPPAGAPPSWTTGEHVADASGGRMDSDSSGGRR